MEEREGREAPAPTITPTGPPVHVSIVATEYAFTDLPPPETVEEPPPPEGGSGATFWVIASGTDPNQYWQDGSQEWVPEVDQASIYNDVAKSAETLPVVPATAYWLDRSQVA